MLRCSVGDGSVRLTTRTGWLPGLLDGRCSSSPPPDACAPHSSAWSDPLGESVPYLAVRTVLLAHHSANHTFQDGVERLVRPNRRCRPLDHAVSYSRLPNRQLRTSQAVCALYFVICVVSCDQFFRLPSEFWILGSSCLQNTEDRSGGAAFVC